VQHGDAPPELDPRVAEVAEAAGLDGGDVHR
jgi:hypothetical protein